MACAGGTDKRIKVSNEQHVAGFLKPRCWGQRCGAKAVCIQERWPSFDVVQPDLVTEIVWAGSRARRGSTAEIRRPFSLKRRGARRDLGRAKNDAMAHHRCGKKSQKYEQVWKGTDHVALCSV